MPDEVQRTVERKDPAIQIGEPPRAPDIARPQLPSDEREGPAARGVGQSKGALREDGRLASLVVETVGKEIEPASLRVREETAAGDAPDGLREVGEVRALRFGQRARDASRLLLLN